VLTTRYSLTLATRSGKDKSWKKEQGEKKLVGDTVSESKIHLSLGKLQKTIRPTELLTPDSTDLFLLRLDDWYVELRGVNAVTTDTKLSWYEGAIEITQALSLKNFTSFHHRFSNGESGLF